jgi:uncharacterized protein YbbK (DUF523 family)
LSIARAVVPMFSPSCGRTRITTGAPATGSDGANG